MKRPIGASTRAPMGGTSGTSMEDGESMERTRRDINETGSVCNANSNGCVDWTSILRLSQHSFLSYGFHLERAVWLVKRVACLSYVLSGGVTCSDPPDGKSRRAHNPHTPALHALAVQTHARNGRGARSPRAYVSPPQPTKTQAEGREQERTAGCAPEREKKSWTGGEHERLGREARFAQGAIQRCATRQQVYAGKEGSRNPWPKHPAARDVNSLLTGEWFAGRHAV
ncbi:MAG: hypothetical protein BJ554DRAFT_5974 [Olpidium bornovanus]|uniref:Uncharacterized protein n=1 Tax=Olpidium bornovanus TaxID=278681 RepID=A0A8H7ZYX1_9FUNG|nr:MAG: hypothetical protein BJ554DRAFT_5974 [Olpidium bornovanus]